MGDFLQKTTFTELRIIITETYGQTDKRTAPSLHGIHSQQGHQAGTLGAALSVCPWVPIQVEPSKVENFRLRISNLHMTGGYVSDRLRRFVEYDLGHWEKQECFCYKCGKPMNNPNGNYLCNDCGTEYKKQ